MPTSTARPIPQPPLMPLLGNIPQLAGDTPVQNMMRLAREHGPFFRLTLPTRTLLLACSHEIVAEVCDERRFSKFIHGPLEQLRPVAGDGLFTAYNEEPNWARAHRILLPAFGPQALRGYHGLMLDIAEQLMKKWERMGPDAWHDVPDNMTRLTLDTIALCGFGYRFNSYYQKEMHPFVDAMVNALAEAGARSRRLPIQSRLMVATQRQFEKDIAYMNEVVDTVIRERRASPDRDEKHDLLALMLRGVDPVTGERLDDVNIRHQIVTFLIAGHETTSGLLSFAIHELLRHPEVLARATAEVDAVLGRDTTRLPEFEDLHKLTYLDRVLRETLRLWPTAPAFGLQAHEDTLLGGRFPVKKGETVLVLTPQLHRDPAVWPDAERFDPERFTPEAVAARPTTAWKPFGNGQRACIGRQFAMQEATLVLAMLLQRFELAGDSSYRLHVKETLTWKPEGLRLRVKRRPEGARVEAPKPNRVEKKAPVAAHGTPLLVLFGSNMGSSEAFARRIARDATTQGWAPTVLAMDAAVGKLPTKGAVVVVTSSYNGQPPDNARAFCRWLEELAPESLSGVRFAVFGCGNRDWAATYQAVPRMVDARLAAAGAKRLFDRGEADARADFFGDFDGWSERVWPVLGEEFGLAGVDADEAPRFTIERGAAAADALDAAHGLVPMRVVENRELVDMSSPFGRSKRHLEIALPEGVTYAAGDHLAILPENPPLLVERAARRFGLSLDESVVVRRTREESTTLPVDRPVSVRELLSRWVELQSPATRQDIRLLAKFTACPPEKMKLAALAADDEASRERYRTEVLEKRVTVLELLEQFAACELPFAAFLDRLPELKPRRYSIASSPLAAADRVSLTVSVLDAPAWSGRGRYEGTASTFLARLAPGATIRAAVKSPSAPFRPPDDATVPMVLVAAGTGLAPFRGFLEERAMRQDRGEKLGTALLFFGCDHPDVDFLYRDELAAWQARGVVEVLPAFCRAPQDGATFVQHRLWVERERVGTLLEAGARVFVCGDGRFMAPAVRETFGRIHRERTGGDEEAALAWLRALDAEKRYLADVFA